MADGLGGRTEVQPVSLKSCGFSLKCGKPLKAFEQISFAYVDPFPSYTGSMIKILREGLVKCRSPDPSTGDFGSVFLGSGGRGRDKHGFDQSLISGLSLTSFKSSIYHVSKSPSFSCVRDWGGR